MSESRTYECYDCAEDNDAAHTVVVEGQYVCLGCLELYRDESTGELPDYEEVGRCA